MNSLHLEETIPAGGEQFCATNQHIMLLVGGKFAEDQGGDDQVKRGGGETITDQGSVHVFQGHAPLQAGGSNFLLGLAQYNRGGVYPRDGRFLPVLPSR